MPHLLVDQLRFTRSEWQLALANLSDQDAQRRVEPMNSISWIIGHLAGQEQRYWLYRGQGKTLVPQLNEFIGYGSLPSTPPLQEMLAAWHKVTEAADPFLDTLTPEILQTRLTGSGEPDDETAGSRLQRVLYHYWYHIGEILAIRQMLGHRDLPEFVDDFGEESEYRLEK